MIERLCESFNSVVGVDGDVIERNKKQKDYLEYINTHVANVKKAFNIYFLPLLNKTHISNKFSDEEFKDAIRQCEQSIAYHDLSKYGEDEFEQYRLFYHPTQEEKSRDQGFQDYVKQISEEAWEHHYTNNAHHPAYWIDKETNTIKDMTLPYIIEMICDWEAMSMYFNSDSIEWYKNSADKEKSQMTEKTKEIVEEILFNITHI